jgi:hypothetical protein
VRYEEYGKTTSRGRLVSYQSQLWTSEKSQHLLSSNIVTFHGSCFIHVTHPGRVPWLCSRLWRSLHRLRVSKVVNQPRIESSLLFQSIGGQCVGCPPGIPTSGLSSLVDRCLGGRGFKLIQTKRWCQFLSSMMRIGTFQLSNDDQPDIWRGSQF